MDDFLQGQIDAVQDLEPKLGLDAGFFRKLRNEDDWSFIIKACALIESSLSQLIEVGVNPAPLSTFLITMNMSGRHSKVRLLQELGLLGSVEIKIVEGLFKIRNQLAHKIRYVRFNLEEYVNALEGKHLDEFLTKTCGMYYYEAKGGVSKGGTTQAQILAAPKDYVWLSVLYTVAMAALRIEKIQVTGEADNAKRASMEKQAELLRMQVLVMEQNMKRGMA